MSKYRYLARYYDALTENAEYEVRSDVISNFFSRYGVGGTNLLDLACGTGAFSDYFSRRGYTVTGLDLSEEMLTVAAGKGIKNAVFVHGDMTDFTLPYPADACICMMDALNHLKDMNAVKACFSCVHAALKEDGLFVFDVNTPFKHEAVLGDNAFLFDEEGYFLAWENTFLGEGRVQINLDFFIENEEGSYDRRSEEFIETAYDRENLEAALAPYFTVLEAVDESTLAAPHAESERIYYVCKRK